MTTNEALATARAMVTAELAQAVQRQCDRLAPAVILTAARDCLSKGQTIEAVALFAEYTRRTA